MHAYVHGQVKVIVKLGLIKRYQILRTLLEATGRLLISFHVRVRNKFDICKRK